MLHFPLKVSNKCQDVTLRTRAIQLNSFRRFLITTYLLSNLGILEGIGRGSGVGGDDRVFA